MFLSRFCFWVAIQQPTLELPSNCLLTLHRTGEFTIWQKSDSYTTSCLATLALPPNLVGQLQKIGITGSPDMQAHILGNGERFGNRSLKITSSIGTTALTDGVLADLIKIEGKSAVLWGVEAEVLTGDVDRFGYPERNSISKIIWEKPPADLHALLPARH